MSKLTPWIFITFTTLLLAKENLIFGSFTSLAKKKSS